MESLVQLFQVAVRCGIILARAAGDLASARAAFEHLERDLWHPFDRPAG